MQFADCNRLKNQRPDAAYDAQNGNPSEKHKRGEGVDCRFYRRLHAVSAAEAVDKGMQDECAYEHSDDAADISAEYVSEQIGDVEDGRLMHRQHRHEHRDNGGEHDKDRGNRQEVDKCLLKRLITQPFQFLVRI